MNTKGINIGGKTYYTVCVHDHRFHSDDVFAVALLEQLFLQFELQQDDGVQHVARQKSMDRLSPAKRRRLK